MQTIWAIGNNPRRKKRRGKRRMSAKQAAFFAPKKRRSRRGGRRASVGKRRSRRSGSVGRSFSTHGAMTLLKAGAIGGAGAVLVDVGMGQVSRLLASAMPSMATPVNTDGSPNYGYYATKAGLAIALGTYGARFTGYAPQMAEGALTVLAYQFMRPLVPASLALGYVNPAPTMRRIAGQAPGSVVAGTGRYLPMGAYMQTPVRGSGAGAGSRAANVLALRGR